MAGKGLQALYNLILKDVVKGSGQASGIMSIGGDVRKLADKKLQRYIDSAKKQGVDLDKLSEQEIKYMIELNKPKAPQVFSNEEAYKFLNQFLSQGKKGKGEVVKFPKDKIKNVTKAKSRPPETEIIGGIQTTRGLGDLFPKQIKKTVTVRTVIEDIKKLEPIEAMKEANKVLKGEGRYKSLSKADREKIAGDESVTDHIFEREIKTDPEDMADGGRIGFAGGTPSPSILDVLPPDFDDFSTDELKHLIKLLQAGEIPQFADGGVAGLLGERPGYQDGLGPVGSVGPVFKTNKPKDALKEYISRIIGVEPAKIPLSDKDALTLMFDLDRAMIGGQKNIFGGELDFSINKGFGRDDTGIGLNFTKQFASGGRVPFAMGRRAFLKLMGTVGAGIGAAKAGLGSLFKAGKPVTKAAEVITTPSAPGKPAWFDALVTRVINEGDDVTKKFATKEREIVHLKKIDEDATVRVHRNLDDGTVRVDIDDPTTNVADEQGNAIVSMEVKGGQLEQGVKGKTPAEFEAVETDYGNYMDTPDDFITEAVENTVSDTKDLTADLTKVKMYAKGQKKPTIKEMMIQRERARDLKLAEENPAEYASGRQPDIDYSDYDNYASGGVARLLGE